MRDAWRAAAPCKGPSTLGTSSDRDEEVGGGGNEGRSDLAVQGECLDSEGGFSPIGGEDERSLEGSGTVQGSIHSRDEFRDGQNGLKGSVQRAIERRDFGESSLWTT